MYGEKVGFSAEDYEKLNGKINRPKMYKLADIEDKIIRIAFDVVRFRDDDNLDKLWVVQEQNGEEVIVAMYEDEEGQTKSAWAAIPDATGINVFYKSEPITRFSFQEIGIPKDESDSLCRCLPVKLAADNRFRKSFLNDLSDRDAVYARFPELKVTQ